MKYVKSPVSIVDHMLGITREEDSNAQTLTTIESILCGISQIQDM
jgi:hypothetical protein